MLRAPGLQNQERCAYRSQCQHARIPSLIPSMPLTVPNEPLRMPPAYTVRNTVKLRLRRSPPYSHSIVNQAAAALRGRCLRVVTRLRYRQRYRKSCPALDGCCRTAPDDKVAAFEKSLTLAVSGRFVNAIPSLIPSVSLERYPRYPHNRNAALRSSCSKALAMRAISARLEPTS
jgi:hypothetical protein